MVGDAPPVRRRRISIRALHWRVAANLTGTLLRLVPRRFRFPVALGAARVLAPIVSRTMLYRHRVSRQDGPGEESLRLVLRAMVRLGVPFDPVVDVDGASLVPDGPALFVSGHFMLNVLLSRWLHDRGEPVTIIHWRPPAGLRIIGTGTAIDALDVTPQVLLRIRGRLAEGRKVIVDVDGPDPASGQALALPNDTVYVSDRVFRLAETLGVPVRFFFTHIVDGRPRITFVRPSSPEAATAVREFRAFYLTAARKVAKL